LAGDRPFEKVSQLAWIALAVETMRGETVVATHPALLNRKASQKAILDHVLRDVLGFNHDDLLLKALDGNGLESIGDVVSLSDSQIDTLSFDQGTERRLVPLASRNKLRILRSWNFYLRQGGRCVDWWDATVVNEDAWDEFRVAIYHVPITFPKSSVQRPRNVTRAASLLHPIQVPAPVVSASTSDSCFPSELAECLVETNRMEDKSIVGGEPERIVDGESRFNDIEDVSYPTGPFVDGVNASIVDDGDAKVVSTVIEFVGPTQQLKAPISDRFASFMLVDCCGDFQTTGPSGCMFQPVDFGDDDNDLVDYCVSGQVAKSNVVFDPGGEDRDVSFHISAF
jgi:hypothetical protein